MYNLKKRLEKSKVDNKELELPETVYVRDIENRVFQAIVLQCLSKIDDVALTESNFIGSIFGRGRAEALRGVLAEQDNKNHSVKIRVEVNVAYGVSIPEKADEIQDKVTLEITRLTGLHVSRVHVVFKNVLPQGHMEEERRRVDAEVKALADQSKESESSSALEKLEAEAIAGQEEG